MIATEFYEGQGLGNQLWCYVVTRAIALKNGYKFGIIHPERFKGSVFMILDYGDTISYTKNHYQEKELWHPVSGADIREHDQNLMLVSDHTKIDGVMQDEKYILEYKDKIREWLRIKNEYECFDYSDENICIINFRGGEYVGHSDLFLPQKYWDSAVSHMRKINPDFKFVVITDDYHTAKIFFPKYEVFHFTTAKDYTIIKNAHYLIISNSSFAWFPAWLSTSLKLCIAPKYWARYNVSDGYWSPGYSLTKNWKYLDRAGNLLDYEECLKDLGRYSSNTHKDTSPICVDGRSLFFLYIRFVRKLSKYNLFFLKAKRKIYIHLKIFLKNAVSFFYTKLYVISVNKNKILKSNIELGKRIKVYDIFTYNGEADVLEIRLNILYKYVDQFIIVEAKTTFSGLEKPLYFETQKDRFLRFIDKITYYVIDDYPNDKKICELADKNLNVPKNGPEHWRREFYQKESIKKALVSLSEDDICFVSDVDEIWNPETVFDYSKNYVYKLRQNVYVYFLNNRSNEPWAGTLVTKYKNIQNKSLSNLRAKSETPYVYVKNGGWHFTSMGGINEVQRKLRDSYTDESYATKGVQQNLDKRFGNTDYLGRNFKFWVDESELPKYLLENKNKYKELFK